MEQAVYSTRILAGHRIYFLDVKQNRRGEYYLVISEKRRTSEGETVKHRIMIFQEDVDKFRNALNEVFDMMQGGSPALQSAAPENGSSVE